MTFFADEKINTKGSREKKIIYTRKFKNKEFTEQYYNKEKDLKEYVRKSKTCIYKENLGGRYRHFELITELYKNYPEKMKGKILNIKKLHRISIYRILNRLPNGIIEDKILVTGYVIHFSLLWESG